MEDFEKRREVLDRRLVNLYGPAYGNRMMHNAGVKAWFDRKIWNYLERFYYDYICELEK